MLPDGDVLVLGCTEAHLVEDANSGTDVRISTSTATIHLVPALLPFI